MKYLKLFIPFFIITYLFMIFIKIDLIDGKWNIYIQIPHNYKIKSILFNNNKEGFVAGSYVSDKLKKSSDVRKVLKNQKAIILRVDKERKIQKVYEEIGAVYNLKNIEKIIYATRVQYLNNEKKITFFLSSKDNGLNWKEVSYKFGSYYYTDFINKYVGLMWGKDSQSIGWEYSVLKTLDGGEKWQTLTFINKPKYNIAKPVLGNKNNFYYFSENKLIKKNIFNGKEEIITSQYKFDFAKLYVDQNNQLWIIGSKNLKFFLLQLQNNNLLNHSLPIFFKGELVNFNIHENIISLFTVETSNFFPDYHFYRSENFGRNWFEEKLKFSEKSEPIYYTTESLIWSLGPMNYIQYRE